jgi:hypothetical protein
VPGPSQAEPSSESGHPGAQDDDVYWSRRLVRVTWLGIIMIVINGAWTILTIRSHDDDEEGLLDLVGI